MKMEEKKEEEEMKELDEEDEGGEMGAQPQYAQPIPPPKPIPTLLKFNFLKKDFILSLPPSSPDELNAYSPQVFQMNYRFDEIELEEEEHKEENEEEGDGDEN